MTTALLDHQAGILSTVSVARHVKGDVLYREGDVASAWFVVVAGLVRTCRFLADGRRQVTGFFYKGDVFGIGDAVYETCAEAVTAAATYRHPGRFANPDALVGDALIEARTRHAALAREIVDRALRNAQGCILLLGHRGAGQRLAAFLLAVAARCEQGGRTALPMPRNDIADYLGLTIETVSRTICDFARRRLIALDTPQDLRILDAAALRALAGGGLAHDGAGAFAAARRDGDPARSYPPVAA